MRYKTATKAAWLGIAVVIAGLGVAAIFLATFLGYLGGGSTVTPNGNFSVAQATEFREFPVFYAGESANGHPLTAVSHDPLGSMRKNQFSVGFLYGSCEASGGFDGGGCSLPVSISNEPACSRNLAMYGQGFGGPVPHPEQIRGARGSFFEGGSRLELQTGTTTVVIFGYSKSEVLSVARSLRGVNVPVSQTEALPPPAPGALKGNVPCPR